MHDSPDWIAHRVEIVATFLCSAFSYPESTPFEPMITCDRILAELPTYGAGNPTITRGVHFPNITRVFNPPSFRNGVHNLDMFVRITFRLLRFLPADKTHLFWYLTHRNNNEAVRYALQDCDIGELSKSLVYHLQDRGGPIFQDTLHAAVVITSVLPHPEAINVAEEVLAGANPTVLTPPSSLHTIRDIRSLEQLDWDVSLLELGMPQSTGSPEDTASAEKILKIARQHRVLQTWWPDVDSRSQSPLTTCSLVGIRITNIYLLFLARHLENCTSPSTAVISATLFNLVARKRYSTAPMIMWTDVYPETQQQVFAAIQGFVQYLADPESPNDPHMFGIAGEMWSSGLFWRIDFGDDNRYPNLLGIDPQYAGIMVNSLRVYTDLMKELKDGTQTGKDCSELLLNSFTSISQGIFQTV
ncbi:hypothetical protein DFH09DRAFT_1488601 [Mycena vulgaris]|nr:hypothetical protein DFH09DRAFT_1488601 [Mycena vulgaris]